MKNGYDNGSWTGPGIRSSTAAVTPKTAVGIFDPNPVFPFTFAGEALTDRAVLLRYTLNGNTYLYDQAVNFDDVFVLAKFYHGPASSAYWVDTNFDGVVDFADILSVAQNYGRSLLSAPTSAPRASDLFATSERGRSRRAGESLLAQDAVS